MSSSKNLLKKFISSSAHWKLSILENWSKIIPEFIEHSFLYRINEDTMFIATNHPCWSQEIKMASSIILAKTNQIIGQQKIKHLKIILKRKKKHKSTLSLGLAKGPAKD